MVGPSPPAAASARSAAANTRTWFVKCLVGAGTWRGQGAFPAVEVRATLNIAGLQRDFSAAVHPVAHALLAIAHPVSRTANANVVLSVPRPSPAAVVRARRGRLSQRPTARCWPSNRAPT